MNEFAGEPSAVQFGVTSGLIEDDDLAAESGDVETAGDLDAPLRPSARTLRVREGLPAGFRMRHDAHYVDELTARPPQPVIRQIGIGDIDHDGPSSPAASREFADSIREYGPLQPILVAARGSRFQIIDGRRRVQAAAAAGLEQIPCIVLDVDEVKAATLRTAANAHPDDDAIFLPVAPANSRVAIDVLTPPVTIAHAYPLAAAPPPLTIAHGRAAVEGAATGSAAEAAAATPAGVPWTIVSRLDALTRAMDAVTGHEYRSAAAIRAFRADMLRAARLARAAAIVGGGVLLKRREVGTAEIAQRISTALAAVCTSSGAHLETAIELPAFRVPADLPLLTQAMEGAADALLAHLEEWSDGGPGAAPIEGRLTLRVTGVTTRPALFIEIRQEGPRLAPDAAGRFFDASWHDRPGGAAAAILLAAAARVVQLHGGRAEVRPGDLGSTVTFILPQMPARPPDEDV